MMKYMIIIFSVFAGCLCRCADSYSDLMYKAEKLTEKRYDKSSRAFKIKSAELDSILASKETNSKKILRLKKYIAELEGKKAEEKRPAVPAKDGKMEYQQAMNCISSDPEKAEALLKQALVYGNYKAASALGKVYSAQISKSEAYRKNAEEYYELALKHGDLSVQLPLAELYVQHFEFLPKQKQADTILWLEQAAESDKISAMLNLAKIHRNSNQEKMLKHLRRAAKLKEPEALYQLGMYYSDGVSTQRSYEKAYHYFVRAEKYDHAASRLKLAGMYMNGQGTIANVRLAYTLYKKLYDSGMKAAGIPLGYLCFYGKGTQKDYVKAIQYIQTGLKAQQQIPGDFTPYAILGIIYFEGGYGVKKDMLQAGIWLKKSHHENNAEAWYLLGCMYQAQLGNFPKDDEAAFHCFQISNNLGKLKAEGALGRMYYYGRGTKQDYEMAIKFLIPVADNNDMDACRLIADAIFEGKVKKNDSMAFLYYEKLALHGDIHGLYRYGQMMMLGRGTSKNSKKAYLSLKKAADKGHIEAAYLCGLIKSQNNDLKKSSEHFRKAADKGHKESMRNFANMALTGRGMKTDQKLGLQYLRILADKGDIQAQEKYAMFMEKGIAPAIKPDMAEAIRYYEMAYKQKSDIAGVRLAYIAFQRKQYKRAIQIAHPIADRKNILAASLIGRLYFEGKGTPADAEKALYYFRIAADGGNAYATEMVGRMYYKRCNYKEALHFLQKSPGRNSAETRYMMGYIYYNGYGNVQPDYVKAFELLNLAADDQNIKAMLLIAKMYQRGEGVEQNYAKAFSWYRLAADCNSQEALYYVGAMYYNGNGVTPNYPEALKWFKKAAEKGNLLAIQYLIIMYREGQGVEKNEKEVKKWKAELQKYRK